MHLAQILEARALAVTVPHVLTAADTDPRIVIQYVPDLGTGGAAATVTYASETKATFQVGAAAPAGNDAIGNSTGELLFSTYTTMGLVLDAINGTRAWRAYLVGALRQDSPVTLITAASASCIGDNGLTLYGDTDIADSCSIAISGEKFMNNGINGHVTDADDQCENVLLYAGVNVFAGGDLKLYTGAQDTDEVQMGADITVALSTLKELGEANHTAAFSAANRGERLIVRFTAQTAGAFTITQFHVLGKTAVLRNDRIVDSVNY